MHTFFVNTSGATLDNYKEILEMQHETRKLVSLDCPLESWTSEETGFKSLARKMGELIDSYKEINNDYNLIVYVDMIAYKEYTAIPMDKSMERYACLQALYMLITRYIRETLEKELCDCGRDPQGVVIIFEQNKRPTDDATNNDLSRQLQRDFMRKALGFGDVDVLERVTRETLAQNGDVSAFFEQLRANGCTELHKGLYECFAEHFDIYLRECETYKTETLQTPMNSLLNRMLEAYSAAEKDAYTVAFVTNRRAGAVNKRECAMRDLRLYFYLLDCIENDHVVCEIGTDSESRSCRALPFPTMDADKWKRVYRALRLKEAIFAKKHRATVTLKEKFSDLKLAPELYEFDCKRFGMDEYGAKGHALVVEDAKTDKKAEEKKTDAEDEAAAPVPLDTKKKTVVEVDLATRKLFSESDFPSFNYLCESDDDKKFWNFRTSADEFIEKATDVREHHLSYLKKLGVHVSEVLSNYAGRSLENEPAILSKRRVSMAEEEVEDTGRGYRYARGMSKETRALKTVSSISSEAYKTAQREYLRFCAGRTVAVTDIEEQCDWFVTRIHQISDSLKKIKRIALGLLIAIFVLYIPYFTIQWAAIVKNAITLMTALTSFAIPFALLYLVFILMSIAQKKQYVKAWKEFKEKSDEVLASNAEAARKYDELLSVFVPSLRFVYEYKIDVDFYEDCCRTARAKLDHHEQKLHDRMVLLRNIREDLEFEDDGKPPVLPNNANEDVDYNVAFCSGERNRAFYAIVDKTMLHDLRQ